jgi:hypothetical protein
MLNRLLVTSLGALTCLTAVTLAPAQADGVRTFTCVGGYGSASCVSTWRRGPIGNPHVIHVPQRSEQELAEIEERDRLWRERCKPVVRSDAFGVGRYTYAAGGCEYGRLD